LGQQSGAEESYLGMLQFSHDGVADDQKGRIDLKVNDGNDGTSPTTRAYLLSDGSWNVGDGTNYAKIKSDGEINLYGTARAWKDAVLNPMGVSKPIANPPGAGIIDGFEFDRYDRGTEESVFFVWTVPNDFASGSASVRGHYTFVVENPPIGTGNENVRMGFEYKKISEGDVFSFVAGTTSGYIDEVIVDGETAFIVHTTADGVVTTTNWVSHDKILFRFYRDATAAEDTYDNEAIPASNDAWVETYHLEYLANKIGEASV
jgi:hypothetical protein